jgi:cyanophycin synthetase
MGPPIRIVSSKYYIGCNIFSSESVIRQRIDFTTLAHEKSAIAGNAFAQKFLERFLGLKATSLTYFFKEEFIQRLSSPLGVSFQEILLEAILAVEVSVAFAMHDLRRVNYAAIRSHGNYTDLIWQSSTPKISRRAAEVALQGLVEILPDKLNSYTDRSLYTFESSLEDLYVDARRNRLAPSTSVIKLAAKKQGIPCEILGAQHLVLGEGRFQHHVYASMTDTTSIVSQKICINKHQTNHRLSELRLPVAKQRKVGDVDAAHAASKQIGFPVVVKPVKGKKGYAVTAGITSPELLAEAFFKAHKSGADVLIEQFIPGDDYRLLVIDGKFRAAVKRIPPSVTGDGVSTVEALIDQLNEDPYRDRFRGFPVKKDGEVARHLQEAGVSLDDVLEQGRIIALRSAANVSTGGIPIDVTEMVHKDNREMAERSAAAVGLNIAGIDFITADISQSYRKTGGAIIEINARPGLDIHVWPRIGKSRNVAADVLGLIYPGNSNGRIPVVAVAGDKGIGAPARSLDMILRGSGRSVALVLREYSYLNGKPSEMSKSQQKRAFRTMIRDPDIEALVSTVSLRRAANRGLILEQCTLSIIMDKMIEKNTEQFYHGLNIIERATTHCFVVGAGNILVINKLKIADKRRLIMVGDHFKDPTLQSHLADGKTAVTTKWRNGGRIIVLLSGANVLASIKEDTIFSRGGRLRKRRLTKGLMYAIAAAHGLGMSGPEIERAIVDAPSIVPDLR